MEAADETGIDELILIVGSGEGEEIDFDEKHIRVMSAIEWFLRTAKPES